MKKIGIIGVDSGHFEVFVELILKYYSHCYQLVFVYDHNSTLVHQKLNTLGLSKELYMDLETGLENVDAALILGRFADSHLAPAIKCFQKEIPIFIDKPIVNSSKEFEKLESVQREFNGKLLSFSIYRHSEVVKQAKEFLNGKSLIGAYLVGPRYCKDLGDDVRFNDIYFYGIHLVEILTEVLGCSFEFDSIVKNNNSAIVNLNFSSGFNTVVNFSSSLESEQYTIALVTTEGTFCSEIRYAEGLYEASLRSITSFFEGHDSFVSIDSSRACLRILDYLREN